MKGLNLNKITTLILLVLWLFVMWKTLLKQPTKITIPTFEPKNEGISSLQEPIGQPIAGLFCPYIYTWQTA